MSRTKALGSVFDDWLIYQSSLRKHLFPSWVLDSQLLGCDLPQALADLAPDAKPHELTLPGIGHNALVKRLRIGFKNGELFGFVSQVLKKKRKKEIEKISDCQGFRNVGWIDWITKDLAGVVKADRRMFDLAFGMAPVIIHDAGKESLKVSNERRLT